MPIVTLIPGDGIGPEISESVKKIFTAAGADVTWDEQHAGETALKLSGELLPPALLESIIKNKVALKGPVTTPIGTGFSSINVRTVASSCSQMSISFMPGLISLCMCARTCRCT